MPTFQYYQISQASHPGRSMPDLAAREGLTDKIIIAAATTRAYTRVVLRLRAQAEAEHAQVSKWMQQNAPPSAMRSYSRPPSPTFSSAHGHSGASRPTTPHKSPSSQPQQLPPNGRLTFRSPLVKLRRAPLLRVFVPNPDSDWLSDTNVLECESELKKAGVTALLRPGDVIWDVAVGDEGNLGRMVWDGSYLIVSLVAFALFSLCSTSARRTWTTVTLLSATYLSTCTRSRSHPRISIAYCVPVRTRTRSCGWMSVLGEIRSP